VKKTSVVVALVLLALLVFHSRPAPSQSPRHAPASARHHSNPAAQFDFYLLNLSWSPEFCLTHPGARECAAHPAFVLHGLWPQNNDGTWPHNCSSAPGPANPSKYSDIYPDPSLLQHEWATHGTCSGLSPDAYFSAARKAFRSVKTPRSLAGLKAQTSMTPAQILSLFTASDPQIPQPAMALSCGNNNLTAFEVCLDKNFSPIACSGVRSCRANSVRIPPP
jgi:ribonuclease T2